MKRPKQPSRTDIEGSNQTLGIVVSLRRESASHRRTDDDDVFDDGRRGMRADLAGLEIDLRARAVDDALLEVHDPFFTEGRNHGARLRVQGYQSIAHGRVQHALVAFAVSPVGQAPSGQLAR